MHLDKNFQSTVFTDVTVVIPLYNGEAYIQETIEGILRQTKRPFEIIVVNDGSTDNSEKLAREYPVVIINQINKGISGARNTGIKAAKSEWIALCDQDDVWIAEKLDIQWEIIRSKPDVDIVFSNVLFISDGMINKSSFNAARLIEESYSYQISPNVYRLDSDRLCISIKSGNIITPSTILVRKSIILPVLFDETMIRAEDRDLFLRMFPSANVVMVDQPLVYYRIHENNNSLNTYKMMIGSALLTEKIVNNNNLYTQEVSKYMSENAHIIYYNVGSFALHERNFLSAIKFLKMSLYNKVRFKTLAKLCYAFFMQHIRLNLF